MELITVSYGNLSLFVLYIQTKYQVNLELFKALTDIVYPAEISIKFAYNIWNIELLFFLHRIK